MAKKVKKKIKFKIIPILILMITTVGLYFLFSYIVDTKIQNIIIFDNELLTDQEIIDLAGLNEYPSFYKTRNKTIINKVKKNELIKEVKIKKKLFNVLEIHIKEYVPLFIKDGKVVLDNNSKIDYSLSKVPVLTNLEENDVYRDLIDKMVLIRPTIRNKISQIIYSPSEYDKTRFLLYMDDGNHVYVNIIKFKNLNYYDEIYPTLNNKKGTLYLDSGNHFEIFK